MSHEALLLLVQRVQQAQQLVAFQFQGRVARQRVVQFVAQAPGQLLGDGARGEACPVERGGLRQHLLQVAGGERLGQCVEAPLRRQSQRLLGAQQRDRLGGHQQPVEQRFGVAHPAVGHARDQRERLRLGSHARLFA